MAKAKIDLVAIDNVRINDTQEMYFMWKELCLRIMGCSSRKLIFPETISEQIVCWALGLMWNKGSNCDAVNTETDEKIEIKASNSSAPSSFSSRTPFDDLVFAKLDMRKDLLYIYDTHMSSVELKDIKMNKEQTYEDQQGQTRRPRFDIMRMIIIPYNIPVTAIVDLKRLKVTFPQE